MVVFNNLLSDFLVAKLGCAFGKLVIKYIRKPLIEYERQNKVFEFWRVSGTADRTGSIP